MPTNSSLQIEQFIETLYPKQDPAKLSATNAKRQRDEPTADPGEGFIMWMVVILALVFMALLMVRTPAHSSAFISPTALAD